jgi:hypothetical protein
MAKATTSQMRRFVLERHEDVSGTSGTGVVAEGVQFTNGNCAMAWISPLQSATIFQSADVLIKIHGHDGKTTLRWLDA